MGEVYQARDEQLHRDVVLKVLLIGKLGDKAARKQFRKDANTECTRQEVECTGARSWLRTVARRTDWLFDGRRFGGSSYCRVTLRLHISMNAPTNTPFVPTDSKIKFSLLRGLPVRFMLLFPALEQSG